MIWSEWFLIFDPFAFLFKLFHIGCFALKSPPMMKCPVSCGGIMLSRSISVTLVLGVRVGVIISFIFIVSMFEVLGCGISSIWISLWVASS